MAVHVFMLVYGMHTEFTVHGVVPLGRVQTSSSLGMTATQQGWYPSRTFAPPQNLGPDLLRRLSSSLCSFLHHTPRLNEQQ